MARHDLRVARAGSVDRSGAEGQRPDCPLGGTRSEEQFPAGGFPAGVLIRRHAIRVISWNRGNCTLRDVLWLGTLLSVLSIVPRCCAHLTTSFTQN